MVCANSQTRETTFFQYGFLLVLKSKNLRERTNFFTLTSIKKNKGTMDKRVTELHVDVFFLSQIFLEKKLEHHV